MTASQWHRVTLALLLASGVACAETTLSATRIVVNQAGYMSHWPKQAVLLSPTTDSTAIELIDAMSQKNMASWPRSAALHDMHTDTAMSVIDFDDITRPGYYRLRSGKIVSPAFHISNNVYDEPLRLLVRSYYLQRCGIALKDPLSGLQHPVDHRQDGILRHDDDINQAGTVLHAGGGWHDAGDFGKYMATTTIATSRLLDLYEARRGIFGDRQLLIPESGNGHSDLLDEIEVGLTWMLTMQRQDGAVYRKLSGEKWPTAIAPDQDHQTRFIYGVSSPETAKFAAVMAQAARVLKTTDRQRSARCQQAAELAWAWLQTVRIPQQIDWNPVDDSGSGKYLHSNTDSELSLLTDNDDRVWAAAELWLLTRDNTYLHYLDNESFFTSHVVIAEWKNPAALGILHLLFHPDAPIPNALHERMKNALLQAADSALQRSRESGFSLANHRFIWGSNKMAAEEGVLLASAYRLQADPAYWRAAIAQLDFVLGKNPQGISFVSAVGEKSVKHVAHLYGRARKTMIPGLFVGGANDAAQDGIAPKGLGIMSYVDDDRAYSVNEYAIDYNAALIGLMTTLAQAQKAETAVKIESIRPRKGTPEKSGGLQK
jgi:endoglucanase